MRTLIIVLLFFPLVFGSCKKRRYNPVLREAVITGYDYRKCLCCGGLMINFSNDPVPYNAPFRLISNPPSYFGFTDSTKFPVYIKVFTAEDQTRCPGSYVIVRSFELK